jgi:XTP/dITP diphosphohydrolase
MREIVVATKNLGKVKELRGLLADLPLQLKSLNEFTNVVEAEETGANFAENAVIKAQSYALQTGLWSLADDSGLEVEALGNAPGVFSARYAGENASDREIKFLTEGVCKGKIALNPIGTNGFGYDPIFVPDGLEQTFGELPDEIKQKISHRAQAAENIITFLRGFYAASLDQRVFRL